MGVNAEIYCALYKIYEEEATNDSIHGDLWDFLRRMENVHDEWSEEQTIYMGNDITTPAFFRHRQSLPCKIVCTRLPKMLKVEHKMKR